MQWLDRTPRVVVRAHLEMLPRLEAEESLRAVQCIGVGSGSLRRGASSDLIREWVRVARADRPPERLTSMRGYRALGIGYHKVPHR